MNIEELIRKVTIEVLSHMNEKVEEKFKVIVPESISEYPNILENKNLEYVILEENDNIEEYLKDSQGILIPRLSLENLSNSALGMINNKVDTLIIKGLLNNKEVFILDEGIEYKEYTSSNSSLIKLYEDYMEKLIDYGVRIISSVQLNEDGLFKSNSSVIVNKENHSDNRVLEVKLIDQKFAEEFTKKGSKSITLTKKTIITAIAKDIFRENNISIEII